MASLLSSPMRSQPPLRGRYKEIELAAGWLREEGTICDEAHPRLNGQPGPKVGHRQQGLNPAETLVLRCAVGERRVIQAYACPGFQIDAQCQRLPR